MREKRESKNITQKQLVDMLNADGVLCTVSEISLLEKGTLERLIYLASAVEKTLGKAETLETSKQPLKPHLTPSKQHLQIYNALSGGERLTKQELSRITGLKIRAVRKALQVLKYDYPIIQEPFNSGYRLARDVHDMFAVKRLIKEINNKKKIYDKQLRPLIAFLVTQTGNLYKAGD